MLDPLIRIDGLSVEFDVGRPILDNFDLAVETGQKVAITGRSGVGKSTLLNAVAGLVPYRGSISFTGCADPRSAVAMSFQEMILAENLTVIDNLNFVRCSAVNYAFPSAYYLELVGIAAYRDSSVRKLSGGMRRRLSLARALTAERKILIIDESLQEIDFETKRTLVDNLHSWLLWQETTVLQTTHDPFELFWIADRLVELGGLPATVMKDEIVGQDTQFAGIRFRDAELAGLIA